MHLSFTQKKSLRKNFGKLNEGLSIPNLIEVQKNSYNEFLKSKLISSKDLSNLEKGLEKAHFQLSIKAIAQKIIIYML